MALGNEFILSELIKSGSAALKREFTDDGTIISDTRIDTDGSTFGYVERPVYNNEQLVKAVDTVVDELIGPPQREAPAVVLKTIYDDLRRLYDQALNDIQDLQEQLDQLLVENETLKTDIEQLQIQVDLEKLLRASADNERDATNQVLQSVTLDLQFALSPHPAILSERLEPCK